jgi:hypothetical protein
MAFDAVEPIGGRRGDWQAAMISSMVMNAAAMMRTGKVRLDFEPKDFLLEFRDADRKKPDAKPEPAKEPQKETPSWQSMKFIARMHVALANADEARKKKAAEARAKVKPRKR